MSEDQRDLFDTSPGDDTAVAEALPLAATPPDEPPTIVDDVESVVTTDELAVTEPPAASGGGGRWALAGATGPVPDDGAATGGALPPAGTFLGCKGTLFSMTGFTLLSGKPAVNLLRTSPDLRKLRPGAGRTVSSAMWGHP